MVQLRPGTEEKEKKGLETGEVEFVRIILH